MKEIKGYIEKNENDSETSKFGKFSKSDNKSLWHYSPTQEKEKSQINNIIIHLKGLEKKNRA